MPINFITTIVRKLNLKLIFKFKIAQKIIFCICLFDIIVINLNHRGDFITIKKKTKK